MKYKYGVAFSTYFLWVFLVLLVYQINNPMTKITINTVDPKSVSWFDAKIINNDYRTVLSLKERGTKEWFELVSFEKDTDTTGTDYWVTMQFGSNSVQNMYFDEIRISEH